jgi:polyhydroxyalkanoate synthesis repressor PhaR
MTHVRWCSRELCSAYREDYDSAYDTRGQALLTLPGHWRSGARRVGTPSREPPVMSAERVIKKYANRRLYDAAASRHVTLDDLRKLIVGGEKIKVIEDKSGEDLTRATLLQIIAEQEQFATPVLSTELMETVIRFYGNPVQEILTRYLEQSVGTVLRQQQTLQAQMAKALETPMAPIADLARQNMALWSTMQSSMLSAFGMPAPDEAAKSGSDSEDEKNKP